MGKNLLAPIAQIVKGIFSEKAPLLELGIPPLDKHPYALEGRQILPPYLGEMGLEIRGFLGQVEPWLRSDWVIPAQRPALYPKGKAFNDPVFFDYLAELRKHHRVTEVCGQLFHEVLKLEATLSYAVKNDQLDLNISLPHLKGLLESAIFEKTVRKALVDRYIHPASIPTPWVYPLTGISEPGTTEQFFLYLSARAAQCPSYQPQDFIQPFAHIGKHIGVQIRNLPRNPDKNSDISRMHRVADLAASLSGLPIIVYGKQNDSGLPGCPRTLDLIPKSADLLAHELSFLSDCALMISPDSGWCDLMCWLRVPTLLEKQFISFGYEGMRAMRPRLLLLDPSEDAWAEQITTLLNADTDAVLMPDPRHVSLSDQVVATIDLNPTGAECTEWWKEFVS